MKQGQFISTSRKGKELRKDAELLARWLQLPYCPPESIPPTASALQLTRRGWALRRPGRAPQRWHPGLLKYRLSPDRLAREPLLRALELGGGTASEVELLDGTLGFGYDALLCAAVGVKVSALECDPLTLAYSAYGLLHYAPALARRISYRRADHQRHLQELPAGAYSHVYLDPMFPAGGHGGTNLALLRGHGAGERLSQPLLREMLRVARVAAIFKLAPGEEPLPAPGEEIELQVLISKRQRIACWRWR